MWPLAASLSQSFCQSPVAASKSTDYADSAD
jgi:hypothetical protein